MRSSRVDVGRPVTPAEARAFFDTIQQQMAPFVLVSLIETFVILPFVTVITYRLAFDFLDGRAPDPFGETFVATGVRVLLASIVVTAVFAGFLVAGGLIFALLVTSGAGVFLLLLLPILLVFASIVYLRLLPVSRWSSPGTARSRASSTPGRCRMARSFGCSAGRW